jgi:protein-tyrosine phosphatase
VPRTSGALLFCAKHRFGDKMIDRILVVCVGNVCRSPMAAAMLKAAFPDKKIESAGTGALVNEPADPLALRLMKEREIDLGMHRARQMDQSLLLTCDLLLVMEEPQREWIESRWPQARGRVYRWGHWSGFDVTDPHKRGEHAFRETLALLDQGLKEWKERL